MSEFLEVNMMNCPNCGYESSATARFCRNCGAALATEGNDPEAARRAYVRPDAQSTTTATPPPPSIADVISGETLRYPQPPVAPSAAPSPSAPPSVPTASLRKRQRPLKWAALGLALVLAGGIGAAINQDAQRDRVRLSPQERARLELMRREESLNRTMIEALTEQHDRLREEMERRIEEVQRAKEEAERAGAAVTGEPALDLSSFEYPGATSGEYSRLTGRELLTQTTTDDFEAVTKYYRQKLGAPLVQIIERNEKQALFQSPGTPPIAVLVQPGERRGRQWEIVILRSPFRSPVVPPVIAPIPPPKPPAADAAPVAPPGVDTKNPGEASRGKTGR